MPGMATEAELDHLLSLSGTAFDVEFLRLMIRHHEGGLTMAQYAEAHAAGAAVRQLAQSIAETQTAEVQTMPQLLTHAAGRRCRRPDDTPRQSAPAAGNFSAAPPTEPP